MTNRLLSTFLSNISFQQSNAICVVQLWMTMSLILICAEARRLGTCHHHLHHHHHHQESGNAANRFCHNRADGSFDFYYFVLQWPGSFCSRGCCFDGKLPLPASQFTIHGLWPTHVGGLSPCFCPAPNKPGPNKMTWELQQEMMANWVSMTCPNPKPEGFWKHEWMKHGSCSGMNQLGYFQAAIDLHAIYNLQDVLNQEGIYADGQMYDLQELYQVLENYIGEEPIITCSFNEMHQVYQIYEVYICLDKYDLLPSPCPDAATFRTNCGTADALFPEFTPLQPPCQFNPPVSLYCTDPSSPDELNPSDEENLESYLDTVDSDMASDDDEFQYFLENSPVNELEPEGGQAFYEIT